MTEMTQREAVRRAWAAAQNAEVHASAQGRNADWPAVAQAWAALAAQLPFEQDGRATEHLHEPGEVCPVDGCWLNKHVPVPRPLERRDDPTNVRTPAELEREAAQAALRSEPVPDPRADETVVLPVPRNTAVPRPGTISLGRDGNPDVATCMCDLAIWLDVHLGWTHHYGGAVCPR